MDSAANAVLDVTAPPPRSAPARASSATDPAPSFEAHLQAASPAEQTREATDPAQSAQAQTRSASSETAQQGDLAAAPSPQHMAPPVAVQLIAAPGPQQTAPTPAGALEAAEPMQGADTQSAPSAPAAPKQDGPPQASPTKNGAEASSKATAPANNEQATPFAQPGAPAPMQAPVTQPNAALPAPAPIATAPSTPEAAQIAATTPAPLSAPRPAEHAQRPAKAASAHADAKSAPTAGPERSMAPPPTNFSAKAAAPQNSAKTALPPIAADSLEAHPSSSTSAPIASAHGSATQHAGNDLAAMRAAPAAHQVAREIVRRFEGGATRFELRLDPPELGRVEVRLEVSRDQRVTAAIAADSPQALTELARHARDLEQMLQSAGLELSENGLSFDLRQNRESEGAEHTSADSQEASAHADDVHPIVARPLGYERWRGVRVDMMV